MSTESEQSRAPSHRPVPGSISQARRVPLLGLLYPHAHSAGKRIAFHAEAKFILLDKNGMMVILLFLLL